MNENISGDILGCHGQTTRDSRNIKEFWRISGHHIHLQNGKRKSKQSYMERTKEKTLIVPKRIQGVDM